VQFRRRDTGNDRQVGTSPFLARGASSPRTVTSQSAVRSASVVRPRQVIQPCHVSVALLSLSHVANLERLSSQKTNIEVKLCAINIYFAACFEYVEPSSGR
jgi:hypothetical protein